MDAFEINKFVLAGVSALLIYLGLNFFAELIYHGPGGHHGEEQYAYAIEVEEEDVGGEAEEEVDIAQFMPAADPAKGEKVFGKCKACHKLEPGDNATGPHLYAVVGRDIAAVDGYSYSGALADMPGDWTVQNLSGFLERPKSWAPGTKMGFAGLKKPEDRADVIAYLQTIGG